MARKIPPEPPYRWRPLGTEYKHLPEPGDLIAWRHAAWRVTEVNRAPETDWPDGVRERMEYTRPEYRDRIIPRHVFVRPAKHKPNGDPVRDMNATVSLSGGGSWDVYPSDHYPVCSECGEPLPCRAEMARQIGEKAEKDAARYEIPGVCPACQEIPTSRHKVMTFEENLRVPFGPPVTFHVGRRDCRYVAMKYEREYADHAPGYQTVLSCPGHIRRHADGPECTEGDCRGLKAHHQHVYYCDDRCLRCRDYRAAQEDSVKARNAAGDWTTW